MNGVCPEWQANKTLHLILSLSLSLSLSLFLYVMAAALLELSDFSSCRGLVWFVPARASVDGLGERKIGLRSRAKKIFVHCSFSSRNSV